MLPFLTKVSGAFLLLFYSQELTSEFGKVFSSQNLERMRTLYKVDKNSSIVLRKVNLSWVHYVFLMRLDNRERNFYELESIENQGDNLAQVF